MANIRFHDECYLMEVFVLRGLPNGIPNLKFRQYIGNNSFHGTPTTIHFVGSFGCWMVAVRTLCLKTTKLIDSSCWILRLWWEYMYKENSLLFTLDIESISGSLERSLMFACTSCSWRSVGILTMNITPLIFQLTKIQWFYSALLEALSFDSNFDNYATLSRRTQMPKWFSNNSTRHYAPWIERVINMKYIRENVHLIWTAILDPDTWRFFVRCMRCGVENKNAEKNTLTTLKILTLFHL